MCESYCSPYVDARLSMQLKTVSDVDAVVNAQTNKALTQKEYVIAIRYTQITKRPP
jgi:hypothetical protein